MSSMNIEETMTNKAKLAVVTGGSSGIGEGIVDALSHAGWNIAFCGIHDVINQERIDELSARGIDVLYHKCDVRFKDSVDAFYAAIESHFGTGPNLLVNNAGVQTWSSLMELKEEDWDKVIDTNLKGCFLNTQAAAALMIKYEVAGSIVNLGSGCNQLAFPNLVDYSASKGGIEMFTKVSAHELGPKGIRVNCVAPGGILIERTRQEAPDYEKVWAEVSPLNRVGFPEDIANAVEFFASEKSSFVTGQTLFVDGGVYSKANWPY